MGNNLQKWEYWNRIIGRIHGIMCTSLLTEHSRQMSSVLWPIMYYALECMCTKTHHAAYLYTRQG